MSEAEKAIIVSDVSVRYRVPKGRRRSLKQTLIRLWRANPGYDDFWALRGVDLSIAPGEVLGIIGQNGAGKTTLLSVIARVLKPTMGTVAVRGRIAPLLGLGAGFDTELSGRENVYLNGAILGFSKKMMDERFDRIVEFAELWDFIDAPLKTYSSGMLARLGFAIATDVDADILLVDEVLAVGDERFQKKCLARMNSFRAQGTTILLVTHFMETVLAMCNRAIWLEQGQIAASGEPAAVVQQYRQFLARR